MKCSSYHSVTRAQGEILSVGGGEAAEVAEVDVAKHSLGRYFLLMVLNFLTKKTQNNNNNNNKKKQQQNFQRFIFLPHWLLQYRCQGWQHQDKPHLQARVERLKKNTTWLHLVYLVILWEFKGSYYSLHSNRKHTVFWMRF